MSEQAINLGEQKLILQPENTALAGLIAESERRQTEEIKRQHESSRLLEDFEPIPGLAELSQKVHSYLEVPVLAPQARHAVIWEEMANPEGLEQLGRLRGQIVLDLGNGKTPAMFQEYIKQFSAKSYIGVDSRNVIGVREYQDIEGFGRVGRLSPKAGDALPGIIVRKDLLSMASRLPDDSVSVSLNGMDDFIVNKETPYARRLEEEIIRILHPDGLLFGVQNQSGILSELMGDQRLEGTSLPIDRRTLRPGAGYFFLHKKTSLNHQPRK